ncbi:MAG: sorbosone dehydrogenase family protein [Candidatus Acidiferrum sp.]
MNVKNVGCIMGERMIESRLWRTMVLSSAFLTAIPAFSQVTHGKKPDLPPPFATKSAGNGPDDAKPPAGFLPKAPNGFQVSVYATDFTGPRFMIVAPNGDIFLADMGAGQVVVLHDQEKGGGTPQKVLFADKLTRPFGIAFHDDYVYVGNMTSVVRFRYEKRTSKRIGNAEHIMDLPGGGHETRTVAFSPDGSKLYVSIGSASNIGIEKDHRRAAVLVSDPNGKNTRIYASGLRNPVGLAIEPVTGEVWVTVYERDELGDNLPPDYFTSLKDGGFYGWPYSYIGNNVDPRVRPQRPDLVAKAIIPDVLLGAHVAPLQFAFYTGNQFPMLYRGGAFIAEHGSWNRSIRNGYQVAFVGFRDGKAVEDPIPFLTGFDPYPKGKNVNGRPVGVVVAPDGSLMVSDDGAGMVYRVSYGR